MEPTDNVYKMARYAYTNVPVYMRIAENMGIEVDKLNDRELWDAIPCIEKSMLVNEESDCISVKFINKLYQDKLIHVCTSGSTGMYMNIFWDKSDYMRSLTSLWLYRRKFYSINPDDKLVYFYTLRSAQGAELEYEYGKYSMGISKLLVTMDRIQEVYMEIHKYSPKWMMLQPSVALMLCQVKKKYKLPDIKTIAYIEMTGEFLSKEVRNTVKETFKCNIANQYGCNEVNSIAYECPNGNMHCMADNVYTSITDNDIYITTLRNFAMPLVKYGLGDNVVWDNSLVKCPCGCDSPVLIVNNGRQFDYIRLPDGGKTSSSCIHRLFDIVNMQMDGVIKQYNVLQEEYDLFTAVIVVDEDMYITEMIKHMLTEMLSDCLGYYVNVNIREMDMIIPNQKTGKLKSFECLVDN